MAVLGLLVIGTGARPTVRIGGMIMVEGHDQVFATIPSGTSWVGNKAPDAEPNEAWKAVSLRKPFFMATTEVTQGLWQAVMGSNPVATEYGRSATNPLVAGPVCADWGIGETLPVFCVVFEETLAFCNTLSRLYDLEPPYTKDQDGNWRWDRRASGYRLPTPLEWEVAARAGHQGPWDGADDPSEVCQRSNIGDRSGPPRAAQPFPCDDHHATPAPVGSFASNAFGLYDTTGNVAEWVWTDRDNELAPIRLLKLWANWPVERRGGSYADGPHDAALGRRQHTSVAYRWPDTGLRLARGP
jgi:formylglycine-generating enzyme required for sulfatase activity